MVVPLAVVDRPDRVGQAVVSSLGLRIPGEAGPEQIAAGLADRELLLVLDNCEHVVDACRELVAALRRDAPGVRVLATSRVTLQVPGEYVVRLQPLPGAARRRGPRVPADASRACARSSSTRAGGAPDFELTEEDAPDLVEVLRRLDGLPLGIELAARQVAVMPLRAVRERLDRALDLSTGREGPEESGRDAAGDHRVVVPPAHRRRATPAPGDRALHRRRRPGDGRGARRRHGGDPLDLLHRLVDSSLLVADAASARYRLLFTVRAFLVDEIIRLGEAEEAHARFVERCRVIAEDIGERMLGPDEAATDRRLRDEVDNLRAARDLAPSDARVAITLAVNQVATWRDLREIWAWAVELAEDPTLAAHPDRAAILAGAAEAARLVGDFDAAERRADEAIAAADPDDPAAVAEPGAERPRGRGPLPRRLRDRPRRLAARGRRRGCGGERVRRLGRARRGVRRRPGHRPRAARPGPVPRPPAAPTRAFVAYVEGELRATSEPEESVPFYVDAIAEAARVGCTFVEGVARVSLASARARIGDVPGAAEGFGYLIAFWRRTGQTTQLWTTARNAAELLAAAGRSRTAALLLVCADAAPGAAAVDEEIARFSGRSYTPVDALVDADELDAPPRRGVAARPGEGPRPGRGRAGRAGVGQAGLSAGGATSCLSCERQLRRLVSASQPLGSDSRTTRCQALPTCRTSGRAL